MAEYEFPVSPAQARMLVLDRLDPGTAQYNVPVAFEVRGPFDVGAFAASLDAAVARHESLRTTFRPRDGRYVQVVAETAKAALRVEHDVPPGEIDAVLRAEAARPFDVETGPLLRCVVYALRDGTHRVLLTVHHLVCDGWSLRLLLDELGTGPQTGLQTGPAPLQYPDYTAWQIDRLAAHALDESIDFWVKSLEGAPRTPALPTDHPRPAVLSTSGGVVRVEPPANLRTRLAKVAAERDATPFTVLFAAFAAFLSGISGRHDLVVAVPVSGRDHPDVQDLVGLLANTLAIRADVSGDPPLLDLVTRLRDRLRAAQPHQEAPFEAVVAALVPARELSHAPLVQVMLAYDDDTDLTLDLPGATTRRLELLLDDAKFDLLLSVQRDGDDLAAHFVYRTDLYDPGTMRHWARAFATLLDGLLDHPDAPVSTIDPLPPADRHLILETWNRTTTPTPSRLVPDLVADRAAERPDATAVVHGSTTLTYRELLDRADRLAARLRAAGVGPEVPVGLCLPRGAEMVVAALAVLRAGGAYVPLDPGHPEARLRFMIADAGVRLLVSGDLDVLQESSAPEGAAGPANTAYILYTSGSTGTPKGVAVEHRALLNLATAVRPQFPVTAGDRVLQYVSFGFDVAVSDLFFTLVAGAELHIAGEDERLGDDLYARLRDSRITYVFLPPSAAMSLPCPPGALPELRTMAIGGEACPPELVERWATPSRRVVDAYGPSETTVYATTADLAPGRPVVIGRPVANTRAYVLDARLRPVPVGVTGEIYLAGAGVARGYANRPGLTAERFVADPYGPPGGRMYRTGDLGRLGSDGNLSYLGRVDTQVKLRGFRVELGEIETVLAAHPGVRVAAAAVRGDRLAVYAVAAGDPPSTADVRAWLAARLPGYMVPETVVFLAELPVGRSGKVDRSRLPDPPLTRPDLGRPYVAPATATERHLAAVWERALDLPEVGLHDNFFDLGGNSIRLLGVLAELRERHGDLTLVDLFRRPTVAALAAHLDGPGHDDHDESRRRGQNRRERLATRRNTRGANVQEGGQ